MRLWSLHPKHLDGKGLVALWAEGLLARKVLEGRTRGFTRHPQLARFRKLAAPPAAVNAYLAHVLAEGKNRGYNLDGKKLYTPAEGIVIPVTEGQLKHEWNLLLSRLKARAPDKYEENLKVEEPEPHPIFKVVPGEIADWEKTGG